MIFKTKQALLDSEVFYLKKSFQGLTEQKSYVIYLLSQNESRNGAHTPKLKINIMSVDEGTFDRLPRNLKK